MLTKLIPDNYNLEIENLTLLDSHFGTEIYLLDTDDSRYIVKTLPLHCGDFETEGNVTEYLRSQDIAVACLLKTKDRKYQVITETMHFSVQEFIDGESPKLNTAPVWLLESMACTLGRIHNVLKSYQGLKTNFDNDFFRKATVKEALKHYKKQLAKAKKEQDVPLTRDLEIRLKHLKRLSKFKINANKLTYSNSHGDFHFGQIITNDRKMTVIDWTSVSMVPVALEIIVSYVTAAPDCANGAIDRKGLLEYISHYVRHSPLTQYDVQMMPYLLYFQQLICHYPPPYENVPESYQPICVLINNLTDWLYDNADILSKELQESF